MHNLPVLYYMQIQTGIQSNVCGEGDGVQKFFGKNGVRGLGLKQLSALTHYCIMVILANFLDFVNFLLHPLHPLPRAPSPEEFVHTPVHVLPFSLFLVNIFYWGV